MGLHDGPRASLRRPGAPARAGCAPATRSSLDRALGARPPAQRPPAARPRPLPRGRRRSTASSPGPTGSGSSSPTWRWPDPAPPQPSASRAPRARLAAVFDIGCAVYFVLPTAPPWWASEQGLTGEEVRRIMVEVGEETWGSAWPRMYGALGGNPWAAMPSLHFATSLTAAISLAEAGPVEGAVGWGYALTPRLRPRLPGRALRHRPRRRGAAGRRRAARGAAGRTARAAGQRSAAALGAPRERVASPRCLRRTRRTATTPPSCRSSRPGGWSQTAIVVLALLVGIYFLFPKLVGLGDALEQARRRRPGLDRRRDRLQRPRLRHLHRALQGRGRRQGAAAHLGGDLRDQHGRAWRRRCSSRRRAPGGSCSPSGRCARRGCAAATWRGGWSPSSPCTTPSTRWR